MLKAIPAKMKFVLLLLLSVTSTTKVTRLQAITATTTTTATTFEIIIETLYELFDFNCYFADFHSISLSLFLFLSLYLSKEYTIGISNIKKINRIANEFSGGLQPSNNHRKKNQFNEGFSIPFFSIF